MGKSQVPGGCTKKSKCKKCGRHFFDFMELGSQTLRGICTICKPIKEKGDTKDEKSI